jgi:hypothetical protein
MCSGWRKTSRNRASCGAGKPAGPRIKLEQVVTRVPAGLGMADGGSSTLLGHLRILCRRLFARAMAIGVNPRRDGR